MERDGKGRQGEGEDEGGWDRSRGEDENKKKTNHGGDVAIKNLWSGSGRVPPESVSGYRGLGKHRETG